MSNRDRLRNALQDLASLPIVATIPRGSVTVEGITVPLAYDFRRWIWRFERQVEIPLGLRALSFFNPRNVLEIGNVLMQYGAASHRVVDKYEQGPGVLNDDVIDFVPDRRFDLVISISTLEHVGWDEQPVEPRKAADALARISTWADALFVTIPVGFHRELEDNLVNGGPFDSLSLVVRTSRFGRWEERPVRERDNLRYGAPFTCGNGVLIGQRGIPGVG